jgi:O-antigen ligase
MNSPITPGQSGFSKQLKLCDGLTEGILCFMVVFSPWAFGTTQDWAVAVMNGAGYVLGAVLLVKWVFRWRAGRDTIGENARLANAQISYSPRTAYGKWLARTLASLTVVLLAYCAVSALNARASFREAEGSFEFRSCIEWLPHSYDRAATWQAFRNYLALALAFWAVRDWLSSETGPRASGLPRRLRRLLWVLAINGGLLGMEGILQRLEGSGKLLWLIRPYHNQTAESQFGPYAYRSNAAQYFNLLWPVCLGFWWALHRGSSAALTEKKDRFLQGARILLLPAIIVMAACPIISTSRGGALVAAFEIGLVAAIFLFAYRRSGWRAKLLILLALLCTLSVAGYWGWQPLRPRLAKTFSDNLSGREEIFENARRMVKDFPVFGSGPGTFSSIYQLYRVSPEQEWAAQAHNDWLETRVTFGWVGSVLIALAFLCIVSGWFFPGGIEVSSRLTIFFWISLAGCLLHALADFPLQVYSILFLFVLLCAVLFSFSHRSSPRRSPGG